MRERKREKHEHEVKGQSYIASEMGGPLRSSPACRDEFDRGAETCNGLLAAGKVAQAIGHMIEGGRGQGRGWGEGVLTRRRFMASRGVMSVNVRG